MGLGEAGADYLLFGEPRPDGSLPSLESVVERAAWWAEIFETPCVAYAPSLDAVAPLAATQAEFIALGDAVWSHPEGPAAAVKAAAETSGTPGGFALMRVVLDHRRRPSRGLRDVGPCGTARSRLRRLPARPLP